MDFYDWGDLSANSHQISVKHHAVVVNNDDIAVTNNKIKVIYIGKESEDCST